MIDKVSIKYDVHCRRSKVKKYRLLREALSHWNILGNKSEFYILYKLYGLGWMGNQAQPSCVSNGQAFQSIIQITLPTTPIPFSLDIWQMYFFFTVQRTKENL